MLKFGFFTSKTPLLDRRGAETDERSERTHLRESHVFSIAWVKTSGY